MWNWGRVVIEFKGDGVYEITSLKWDLSSDL